MQHCADFCQSLILCCPMHAAQEPRGPVAQINVYCCVHSAGGFCCAAFHDVLAAACPSAITEGLRALLRSGVVHCNTARYSFLIWPLSYQHFTCVFQPMKLASMIDVSDRSKMSAHD